jgi:cell division protein FtsL
MSTEPAVPVELQSVIGWAGSILVSVFVTLWAKSLFGRGDRAEAERKAADAEWRAEMRTDMKRLLDGQQALGQTQGLQAKDIAQIQQRLDHVERRQDQQAEAHREQVRSLRSEFEARIPRAAP